MIKWQFYLKPDNKRSKYLKLIQYIMTNILMGYNSITLYNHQIKFTKLAAKSAVNQPTS